MNATWIRSLLAGICGVVATGPMTVAMVLWHRRLPESEKYPLPPREITEAVLRKIEVNPSHVDLDATTLVAHFAYGGAVAGLYGLVPQSKFRNTFSAGLFLGLLVWSASYLGLLPALKLLPPATRHPAERNALMIGAHAIWGTSFSLLYRLLLDDSHCASPALQGLSENWN